MVKIGLVQMNIKPLHPERNIKKARYYAELAYKKNVDFLVYPELFITGPARNKVAKYAQRIPGKYTDIFTKLAEEYNYYIIMGSIIENDNNNFYNTSLLIAPNGNIIGKYRKIFLWHPEKRYLSRGNEIKVFNTKFGKIGIEICWDLAFPEISRKIAYKGADVIFCPSYWSEGDNPLYKELGFSSEAIFIDSCVISRAFENQVAFIFVNGAGYWELNGYIDEFTGHSQIALPFYGSIAKLEKEENLLVKEIDLGILEKARKIYSTIDDLKEVTLKI